MKPSRSQSASGSFGDMGGEASKADADEMVEASDAKCGRSSSGDTLSKCPVVPANSGRNGARVNRASRQHVWPLSPITPASWTSSGVRTGEAGSSSRSRREEVRHVFFSKAADVLSRPAKPTAMYSGGCA